MTEEYVYIRVPVRQLYGRDYVDIQDDLLDQYGWSAQIVQDYPRVSVERMNISSDRNNRISLRSTEDLTPRLSPRSSRRLNGDLSPQLSPRSNRRLDGDLSPRLTRRSDELYYSGLGDEELSNTSGSLSPRFSRAYSSSDSGFGSTRFSTGDSRLIDSLDNADSRLNNRSSRLRNRLDNGVSRLSNRSDNEVSSGIYFSDGSNGRLSDSLRSDDNTRLSSGRLNNRVYSSGSSSGRLNDRLSGERLNNRLSGGRLSDRLSGERLSDVSYVRKSPLTLAGGVKRAPVKGTGTSPRSFRESPTIFRNNTRSVYTSATPTARRSIYSSNVSSDMGEDDISLSSLNSVRNGDDLRESRKSLVYVD